MSIIRSKPKNLAEATRYPFMKQTGVLADTSNVGRDRDNNSPLTWSNAAGLYSVEGMNVDASNRLIVGLLNRGSVGPADRTGNIGGHGGTYRIGYRWLMGG